MTPLATKLAALIRANGPITVADYMAACLGDPGHGYYMRAEPFGRGGDFITAPEVSQMFGELIGIWAVATWEAMGAPARFALVELGPGRGTLMMDALRAARVRPAFAAAAVVHLVETSPRLREIQRATLGGAAIAWHATFADVPAGPAIVIANEFFDALPVRQFVRTTTAWAERMVGLDAAGDLAFGLRPSAAPPGQLPDAEEGETIEVAPAREAAMAEIAGRIARDGGAMLAIDYGYEGPAAGDTLQAVRKHTFDDPLAAPGEADLTTHVDFAALALAARAAGATAWPLLTQGELLSRLGIAERAAALSRTGNPAEIAAAAARLTDDKEMGRLFKALAVSSPGLAVPGFG